MANTDLRKLDENEIDLEYERMSKIVECFKSDESPELHLAPYEQCTQGYEALSCPLLGIRSLRIGKLQRDLDIRSKGAEIYVETQAAGGANFLIDVPIWVPDIHHHHKPRYSGHVQTVSKKPSTEWAMFLCMVDVTLGVVLWYRINTGAF